MRKFYCIPTCTDLKFYNKRTNNEKRNAKNLVTPPETPQVFAIRKHDPFEIMMRVTWFNSKIFTSYATIILI